MTLYRKEKTTTSSIMTFFFNQKKETAMRTKSAPTYATLVIGCLEEKLYDKIETRNFGTSLKRRGYDF